MLKFYHGNNLELLSDQLIKQLHSEPLREPLSRELFVVQNHGMARWLSTRIARKNGIVANFKFQFPAEHIWDLYRIMDESIPKTLPSDREPMTWTIFRLLQVLPRKSPYLMVWHYMRDREGTWSPLKAWKLANRIGDIFDQYLVYRPDMLLEWEENRSRGFGAPEAWQADLWRKLKETWNESFTEIAWKHRPGIHQSFMKVLKEETIHTQKLPERITIFGLSGLPPSFIEVFVQLSKFMDINWFWMNPIDGDPLSESWGREGKEFLNLFCNCTQSSDIPIEEIELFDDNNQHPSSKTNRSFASHTLDLFDDISEHSISNIQHSPLQIQIHSCHSPLREVEVLYNNLLDMFENDPELGPDDILILTPDIQIFAPFIEGVFGTSESGLPDIHFHIVDDHTGIRKEAYNTFLRLLHLLNSRFKVTEVLDLLSNGVVRERFDISEDELDQLHSWIDGTNIRWGINEEDKQHMELAGSARFTWQFGLDRMMMGFASKLEDEIFEGIYPYNQIESNDDAALLGKFSHFLDNLVELRTASYNSYPVSKWIQLLTKWIEAFIPSNSGFRSAFQGLNNLIQEMDEAARLGAYRQKVDFPVILDYLENKLSGEATRGGYSGHGITFSGLEQMRNIPFKVIGMIGMDNEAFPRNKVSPDFDLMVQSPKKGDRSQRNDDRYLFLETLQSAKKCFYLSYTGQSNRDDSSRPPSVMISELMDFLQEVEGVSLDDIMIKHPLHSYSSRYFKKENKKLFSYSSTSYEVSQKINGTLPAQTFFLSDTDRLPDAKEILRQISISDLVRFYDQPSRYLLQNRLGIYFREEEIITDDREPFELSGLQAYQLGEELLQRMLNDKTIAEFETIVLSQGKLPEGWPGHQAFRDKAEEVSEFGGAVKQFLKLPRQDKQEIKLEIRDFYLTGVLDSLFGKYQLFSRYGSMRPKDLLELWIYHIVSQSAGNAIAGYNSILVTKENNQPAYYLFSNIENPKEYLEALLNIYWEGIHRKIPLFSNSSFSYAHEIVVRRSSEEKALYEAQKKWTPSRNPQYGEKENAYIKLLFNDTNPIDNEEFRELSLKIWRPIFEALKKGEGTVA